MLQNVKCVSARAYAFDQSINLVVAATNGGEEMDGAGRGWIFETSPVLLLNRSYTSQ